MAEGVQKTYCNMAGNEKLIRDGSISVFFYEWREGSDVVADNIEQVDGYEVVGDGKQGVVMGY